MPHPEAAAAPEPAPSPSPDGWDDARAAEMQAAIHARLDEVPAAIPADHPRRQSRLALLEGSRRIVSGPIAQHDPALWTWLESTNAMVERWREMDQAKKK